MIFGNGHPHHSNGLVAIWSAAVLVFLASSVFLYLALAANIERTDNRIARAASARLQHFMPRSGANGELTAVIADLLGRGELGLNYLTLRGVDGEILLSGGRFENLGKSLSPDRARRLRGWLYRLVSADHRLSLRRDGRLTGYVTYGVDLRHAAADLSPWYWALFVLWLLVLALVILLFRPVRTALVRARGAGREYPDDAELPPAELVQHTNNGELQWRHIADALGIGFVIFDGQQRVQAANGLFGELIGRSESSLRGRAADELAVFVDDWGKERRSPMQRCLAGEPGPLRDMLNVAGRRVAMIAARVEGNRTYALLWPADDVAGERARASAAPSLAGDALWTHAETAAALVDIEGIVRSVNPAFCRFLRREEEALVGNPLVRLLPDVGGALLSADDVVRGETVAGADDGAHATYRLAMIDTGEGPAYLMTLEPSRESEKASIEPNDPLTGLPVRAMLMEYLGHVWPKDDFAAARALLVVEIVDFGGVNRSLGRDIGDALLTAFARRLAATVPDAEYVARLGGDEFAVLLRLSAGVEDAETTAQRICRAFAEPVRGGGLESIMGVDIGLAVAPEDADSPDRLLQRAETALSVTQEAGDHIPRRYMLDMAAVNAHTGAAARALRQALARHDLTLGLQPVWRGGEVAAARVEVAWEVPEGGRRAGPDLFTYAENLGLTGELAAWCLRAVVEIYADWRNIGLTPVPLLLPLPAEAAQMPMLAQAWAAAESRYRVPPPAIIVLLQGEATRIAVAGPRLARENNTDGADILCLDAGTLKFDAAHARTLVAEARARGIPMILGPLKEEDRTEFLGDTGIEYWYSKDDAPLAARAFGRLIARRGAMPL